MMPRVPKAIVSLALGAAACAVTVAATSSAPAAPDAQRRPTWTQDIDLLVQTRCSTCHRPGRQQPMPLVTYEDVRAHAADVQRSIAARRMPPWLPAQGPGLPTFSGDRRLTDRELTSLRTWFANDMPLGDLRRAPPSATFPIGWPFGVPDVMLTLPRMLAVEADAGDVHRTVAVPIGLPGDIWIRAIDYQPSAPAIVKHVRLFLAPADLQIGIEDVIPGVAGLFGTGSLENFANQVFTSARSLVDLGVWTPAVGGWRLPDGLSIRVPPRAQLVLQIHMQAGDTDAVEDGRVALYYASAAARRTIVPVDVPPISGFALGMMIPPDVRRHMIGDTFTLPVDLEIAGVRAFAHLLARDVTIAATLPTGFRQVLLQIPRWNADWAETWHFALPLRLPKGTMVHAEFAYDNSTENPRNLFLPPRRTGWGRMPGGEVAAASLLVVEPAGDAGAALARALEDHLREQLVRGKAVKSMQDVKQQRR
jgi:hypothetical protein